VQPLSEQASQAYHQDPRHRDGLRQLQLMSYVAVSRLAAPAAWTLGTPAAHPHKIVDGGPGIGKAEQPAHDRQLRHGPRWPDAAWESWSPGLAFRRRPGLVVSLDQAVHRKGASAASTTCGRARPLDRHFCLGVTDVAAGVDGNDASAGIHEGEIGEIVVLGERTTFGAACPWAHLRAHRQHQAAHERRPAISPRWAISWRA